MARSRTRSAAGRSSRPGGCLAAAGAGHPVQLMGAFQGGHGPHQPAGVRMGWAREQLARRADLDQPAGVHHRDMVGDLGHHGEVVADVDGGHLVSPAQPADGVQDAALGGDIKAGRRLVQHDQPRPASEGHGQGDPLLLATGKLMRVGAEDRGRILQAGLGEHLREPLRVAAVDGEDLAQLGADLQHRVQRAGRVLRDVGDRPAAQFLQLVFGQREDVPAVDEHLAAADRQAALDEAEQGERDCRLARTRFTHQAEHVPRLYGERHLVDDIHVGPAAVRRQHDPQVLHCQPGRARAGFRLGHRDVL